MDIDSITPQDMRFNPPSFGAAELARRIASDYGLEGEWEALVGERDQRDPDGLERSLTFAADGGARDPWGTLVSPRSMRGGVRRPGGLAVIIVAAARSGTFLFSARTRLGSRPQSPNPSRRCA